jgi:hypothetical protein
MRITSEPPHGFGDTPGDPENGIPGWVYRVPAPASSRRSTVWLAILVLLTIGAAGALLFAARNSGAGDVVGAYGVPAAAAARTPAAAYLSM